MRVSSSSFSVAWNLLGTVVGAGIFGLPAIFAYVGFWHGTFLFFCVTLLALTIHLFFSELILSVRQNRQTAGYLQASLGHRWKWIAFGVIFLKRATTLLAYVILGGEFLTLLIRQAPQAEWFWAFIFWMVGALIVFKGLRAVATAERELTAVLLGFMLFSVVILAPFIRIPAPVFSIPDTGFFTGFGVMFFSLLGLSVLPEASRLVRRSRIKLQRGIFIGIGVSAFVSWLFGMAIAQTYPGVSGASDILRAFPPIFWWLIPSVGLLAVGTSFLTSMQSLKNMIRFDGGLPRTVSWAIAAGVPLFLYLFVSRNFLETIGFSGAVLSSFMGILICAGAYRLRMRKKTRPWLWRVFPLPVAGLLFLLAVRHLLFL